MVSQMPNQTKTTFCSTHLSAEITPITLSKHVNEQSLVTAEPFIATYNSTTAPNISPVCTDVATHHWTMTTITTLKHQKLKQQHSKSPKSLLCLSSTTIPPASVAWESCTTFKACYRMIQKLQFCATQITS